MDGLESRRARRRVLPQTITEKRRSVALEESGGWLVETHAWGMAEDPTKVGLHTRCKGKEVSTRAPTGQRGQNQGFAVKKCTGKSLNPSTTPSRREKTQAASESGRPFSHSPPSQSQSQSLYVSHPHSPSPHSRNAPALSKVCLVPRTEAQISRHHP